jgi:hypothetical protein
MTLKNLIEELERCQAEREERGLRTKCHPLAETAWPAALLWKIEKVRMDEDGNVILEIIDP